MIEGKIDIDELAGRVLCDRFAEMQEQDFIELKDNLHGIDVNNDKLLDIYRTLIDILKKYLDLKEEYYPIISLWIIGTYFHNEFISYPYLFFY
jgi:hypothetical protein